MGGTIMLTLTKKLGFLVYQVSFKNENAVFMSEQLALAWLQKRGVCSISMGVFK
jgi:hypothetical protein